MKISRKEYEFSDFTGRKLKVKYDKTYMSIEIETNKPVSFHKDSIGELIDLLQELQEALEDNTENNGPCLGDVIPGYNNVSKK